jgi:signal transduction histidine kinase
MVQTISMMSEQLQHQTGVINDQYTPAVIVQLVQSLGRLAFSNASGTLIAGERDPHGAWAELILRSMPAHVQLRAAPASLETDDGFLLIGLGQHYGFVMTALPIETTPREEGMRLYDVCWSCTPETVVEAIRISGAIGDDGVATLQVPPANELFQVTSDILRFAARQHNSLSTANHSLEERLRNQNDQTRMIIHDTRAPLHTLLISLKTLQQLNSIPETGKELLSVAQDSAGYLLNLTETILDSARLETSGWSINLQPVQIDELIRMVCEPLELATRPDQARLICTIEDQLPEVRLDHGLIVRVLTNLLTNAIKFTPASGTIQVCAQTVHDRNSIRIEVSDTGMGIPEADQKYIFDRFYQARSNDRRHGTGLGLYFCRLAVEAHGGSISVASEVGRGSTFTVLLPLFDGTTSV